MPDAKPFPWEQRGDRLVVETPEQTQLEFRVAAFGARIAAALIDNLVLSAATLILFLSAQLLSLGFGGYLTAIVTVAWFLLSMFYFVVYEVRTSGRTLGKRALGLRAILATGHGMTVGASLIRNLARVVDNIPVFWLVPALTRGNRRCGDLLAGTYVIDERPAPTDNRGAWLTRLAPSWQEIPDRRFAFSSRHADALHPDDLNLLEYLESRILRMPVRVRRKALREIADRYVDRLDLAPQRERVLEDPARFLQELGLFLRSRFDEQRF
jgi:uncharacterized RDD family membrane protein YckC